MLYFYPFLVTLNAVEHELMFLGQNIKIINQITLVKMYFLEPHMILKRIWEICNEKLRLGTDSRFGFYLQGPQGERGMKGDKVSILLDVNKGNEHIKSWWYIISWMCLHNRVIQVVMVLAIQALQGHLDLQEKLSTSLQMA